MKVEISGIDHALETVTRFADIGAKMQEILHRLREIGEPIIRDVHKDVTVEESAAKLMITASGEDVLFIEFGTGDMAGVMDALYDQVPSSVGQGTWSSTHAQMYSRYGFWVFANTIYHHTEPHPAFYYAYQAMVQALPQVAKDVFGS